MKFAKPQPLAVPTIADRCIGNKQFSTSELHIPHG
jgi:hypothetical protein